MHHAPLLAREMAEAVALKPARKLKIKIGSQVITAKIAAGEGSMPAAQGALLRFVVFKGGYSSLGALLAVAGRPGQPDDVSVGRQHLQRCSHADGEWVRQRLQRGTFLLPLEPTLH